jgi:hypothetical protein
MGRPPSLELEHDGTMSSNRRAGEGAQCGRWDFPPQRIGVRGLPAAGKARGGWASTLEALGRRRRGARRSVRVTMKFL